MGVEVLVLVVVVVVVVLVVVLLVVVPVALVELGVLGGDGGADVDDDVEWRERRWPPYLSVSVVRVLAAWIGRIGVSVVAILGMPPIPPPSGVRTANNEPPRSHRHRSPEGSSTPEESRGRENITGEKGWGRGYGCER